MWLETIAALLLVLGGWPFLLFGAIGWGLFKFGASAILGLVALLSVDPSFAGFVGLSIQSVIDGLTGAWSVPSAAWHWAKFEHPVIAAIIGVIGLGFQGSGGK